MAETVLYPTRSGKKYEGSDPTTMPCAIFESSKSFKGTIPANKLSFTGKHFSHWNTKADDTGTSYNSGKEYTFTSPTILYGIWENNNYTVKFNANGGTGSMSDIQCVYSKNVELPKNSFVNGTKTFLGWSTSSKATSATYKDGQTINNLTTTNNGTVTLYAVWQKIICKVYIYGSYDDKKGDKLGATVEIEKGEKLNLSSYIAIRTRYKYTGWNTQADRKGTTYGKTDSITINSNLNLYAIWDGPYYKITYSAEGASNVPSTQEKKHDSNINISSQVPTKANNNFTKWLEYDSSRKLIGAYRAGDVYSRNSDANLEAEFALIEYTITFNANGGSGTMSTMTKQHGVAKNLPNCTFSRPSGKYFYKWTSNKDGTGSYWWNQGSYEGNANATLYAQWGVRIVYDANGGSGTVPTCNVSAVNANFTVTSNPLTKTNYIANGWNTKPDGTGTHYDANATIKLSTSITLYAEWQGSIIQTYNYTNKIWDGAIKGEENSSFDPCMDTEGCALAHFSWNGETRRQFWVITSPWEIFTKNSLVSNYATTYAKNNLDIYGKFTSETDLGILIGSSGTATKCSVGGCVVDCAVPRDKVLITKIELSPYIVCTRYHNKLNNKLACGKGWQWNQIKNSSAGTSHVMHPVCNSTGCTETKMYGRGKKFVITLTLNTGITVSVEKSASSDTLGEWKSISTQSALVFDFASSLKAKNVRSGDYVTKIDFKEIASSTRNGLIKDTPYNACFCGIKFYIH